MKAKDTWRLVINGLLGVAAYIIGRLLGFLPTPPTESLDATPFWDKAGLFLAVGVVGLIKIVATKWPMVEGNLRYWCVFTALAFLASVPAFTQLREKHLKFTIEAGGRTWIEGTKLTPPAERYVATLAKSRVQISPAKLLEHHGYKPADVWTRESTSPRDHELGTIYLLAVATGTAAVWTLVTILIHLAKRRRPNGGKPPSARQRSAG